MSFQLPPEITFSKDLIDGQWVYTFRHQDLGKIGRIRLTGSGSNTVINLDAIGDPDDPMTEKRREIFEPIGMALAEQMQSIVGASAENPGPSPMPHEEKTLVKSQIMQCITCDAYVAILIYADNAWSPDRLEDYAQMMYKNYSQMDLPTWIIGSPLDGSEDAPAYILKVWPEREPVRRCTLSEFDPVVCKLIESHCG